MKKVFELNREDRKLALLIDPDHARDEKWLASCLFHLRASRFDVIFLGGSLVEDPSLMNELIREIRRSSELPVYLFPGHSNQVCKEADGILFTSLISGRNPEFLIGQQMLAAPLVKKFNLNSLATGYMLIGDSATSAHYMSQTSPIPYDKVDIAIATALAGELLGMEAIYMDGGSGADKSPSIAMCRGLSSQLSIPIIIGGGITRIDQIDPLFEAGANLLVIGTAVEKDPELILDLADARKVKV